ncbi:hypothetical protein KBB96_17425 [Luteolibacter ambystomatis]|uniref:Uncharacterized protein n=1 Tax=Luteolibacter ambystomatis TaxID=2824561 RepID=A0A975G8C2_9BACT|nr:hypothetical protein [Luteolibacter ambystomatis]QUE50631.1 hypothetical protein KBB96_17425 [Luteolibacter ambystomatis]
MIAEAPTPSVFTSKGDRLVDLSNALKAEETFGEGAWIVWNKTRRLLVAHGNRYTLAHADGVGFLREPHQVGISLAWYRGIGPGEPVSAAAKAIHRSEIVTRSCQHSATRWDHPDAASLGSIEVDASVCSEPDSPIADVQMSVDWQEKREAGALRWDFIANFNTEAQGRAERVISQVISPTGERWTITAKVRDLLLDGTSASERRWVEADGQAQAVHYRASSSQTGIPAAHRLGQVTIKGAALTVAEFDLAVREVKALLNEPDKDSAAPPDDPFATKETALARPPSCRDAILPEELKSYAPVTMWDVRAILAGWGIPLAETDCAAYDPRLGRLLVAFQDATNEERMEQRGAYGTTAHTHVLVDAQESLGRPPGDRGRCLRQSNGRRQAHRPKRTKHHASLQGRA